MATDKGEAEITAWCVAHLAKALRRLGEKSIRRPSSRASASIPRWHYLVAELEEWLGASLPLRWPSNTQHRRARPSPRGRAMKRIPTVQDGPAVLKTGYNSMVELLRARRGAADERAYVFLSDRGGEEASLTFSELERRACACGTAGGPRSARRARAPDVPARA